MIRYQKVLMTDADFSDSEEPCDPSSVSLLSPPQSASPPERNVVIDGSHLLPPRPFPYFSPTMEIFRRRKDSSSNTGDFPNFSVTPPTPTMPPPRSPITAMWEDHRTKQECPAVYPRFKGNVTFKDASVNTDSSSFYEGAPLFYNPTPATSAPPHPPRRPSRPSSFINNLNTAVAEEQDQNVGDVAFGPNGVGAGDYSPAQPEPSATTDLLSPGQKMMDPTPGMKGVEETPRGGSNPGSATGVATGSKRASKFLSALARVGIKTARSRRDNFSPLVMDNSDSD